MLHSQRFLTAALALVTLATCAEAGKVKVWTHQGPTGFDKAQFKGTLVTSEGTVKLARQLTPFAGLDASHVWDLVEDKAGNVFAATGDEGKVYKIDPAGKVTLAYTAEDAQALCLATTPDGGVLVGTGPDGQVLKLDGAGKAKSLFQQANGYVWSLAVDAKDGTIYAATGPQGRIYKIAPDGASSLFYQTKQDHVMCVTLGPDGHVYAGTDKNGLVYRINPQGKGFVVYQAPQAEVRRLHVTADAVYACTSAPTKKRTGTTALTPTGGALALREPTRSDAVPVAVADEKEKAKAAETKASSSDSKEPAKKGEAAAAPTTPASGENSVYRIGRDGSVREVFREKAMLLCLGKQGDRFVVGTGMDGQLFEFDEANRERGELARMDHGQILSLLPRKDGSLLVGTGDPGKLYVLKDACADQGTLLSDVLDAKHPSQWGAMRWRSETPKGSAVKVEVRAGNVADPDETWSGWSEVGEDGKIAAPPARFFQYRATLTPSAEGKATPSLASVNVRYKPLNLAPEVTKLESPDLNAVNLDNPKKVKLKWSATDPNEDELTYSLYVRKQGWSAWVLLDGDLDKTDFEWDTTTTPAGVYQVKVVASDRKDNDEQDARTAEKVSPPFVVCNVPPTVTLRVSGLDTDRAILDATAASPLVRIVEASFAVNGKKWVPVFPSDGVFDSAREGFSFKTEGLQPGTYVVVLKVKDAGGNVGTADAVFTVEAKK
jgi:hypothetical protein